MKPYIISQVAVAKLSDKVWEGKIEIKYNDGVKKFWNPICWAESKAYALDRAFDRIQDRPTVAEIQEIANSVDGDIYITISVTSP